jgi:putative ABC transport system permease protein
MLDEYLQGSASRMSQEAPVPVVELRERRQVPGGAANAAANVAGLGAQVFLVGGVIGIVAALGVGQWAKSLLFELEGHDPMVLAGSAIVLALVALGAGYLPALRASRIDPMQALRYE